MAKPTALSSDLMKPVATGPAAAITPRAAVSKEAAESPKYDIVPFQIRIPKNDRFAIKIASAEHQYTTESEFMLACFNFYMQHHKAKIRTGQ